MKTKTLKFRKLISLLMIGSFQFMLLSCNDNDFSPTPPIYQDEDVYIAGGLKGTYYTRATIWKNDVVTILHEGPRASFAYDVFVRGADVYAAGAMKDEEYNDIPAMWKNGLVTLLPITGTVGEATAIAADDEVSFTVGYENTYYGPKALLWFENQSFKFAEDTDSLLSKFNSIVINDNKIYVAGYEQKMGENARTAKYWVFNKNDFPSNYPLNTYESHILAQRYDQFCDATSITVKSGKVYVCGYDGNNSVLWTDSVPTIIYNGQAPIANSVFVAGNNKYMAGTFGDMVTNAPWYWKDGQLNYFDKDDADVAMEQSIAAGDSNIYVAGYMRIGDDDWAVLWVNGVPHALDASRKRSWAYKVVVVSK